MVEKDINDLPDDILELIKDAVFATHAHIVENTPVAVSTPSDPPYSLGHTGGFLRSSIVVEKTDDGWIIGTAAPYAEFVEAGVSPHLISPASKSALKFFSPKFGSFVFAKEVMHPGFPGRMMFAKGQTFFEQYLQSKLVK